MLESSDRWFTRYSVNLKKYYSTVGHSMTPTQTPVWHGWCICAYQCTIYIYIYIKPPLEIATVIIHRKNSVVNLIYPGNSHLSQVVTVESMIFPNSQGWKCYSSVPWGNREAFCGFFGPLKSMEKSTKNELQMNTVGTKLSSRDGGGGVLGSTPSHVILECVNYV